MLLSDRHSTLSIIDNLLQNIHKLGDNTCISEAASYNVLKHKCHRLVSPLALSASSNQMALSIFKRLAESGKYPVYLLDIHYRMHPRI